MLAVVVLKKFQKVKQIRILKCAVNPLLKTLPVFFPVVFYEFMGAVFHEGH